MSRSVRSALGCALLTLLCSGMSARAQELPRFDLERLSLDPTGTGALTVGGGRLLSTGTFRLGVATQYQRDPLRVSDPLGDRHSLIRDRLSLHLTAAWAPFKGVQLAAELPVIAFQRGADLTAFGLPELRSGTIASPRLSARIGLLEQASAMPFDLAARCPIPDRDGDGVLDPEDACVEVAGKKELKGCPDKDGDTLADRDDRCPDQADSDLDGVGDACDQARPAGEGLRLEGGGCNALPAPIGFGWLPVVLAGWGARRRRSR